MDRLLQKLKNKQVKLKKSGENIGGNELLMDEMIAQANARKGYISRQDLMHLKLMNLTMIAAS